jgi:cytoskeletal protein RodZ
MPPQQPQKKSRVGLIVGVVVAVVLLIGIGVVVAIFATSNNKNTANTGGSPTATGSTPTNTPTTAPNGAPSGLSIDSTASSIITNIQSASSIDSNYRPTNVTKTFQTNATVYVTYNLHLNGQTGYVEVKWYADGQVGASKIFHADQTDYTVGYFSIPYTEAVQGAAELYWCTQSDCSDEALAGYVNFTISDSGYHTSGQMVFSTAIWRRD